MYLLWGELRSADSGRIVALRRDVPRNPGPEIWLVVRAERLDWGEGAYDQLLIEAERWARANGRFAGIQIDFDAATLRLGLYARFLADLRDRLPPDMQLSATGLMDWSAGSPSRDLDKLHGVIDEIVVQTYQGRTTIPDYQRYLPSLKRLDVPYRIGLVEGGEWNPPADLETDPLFNGYVVFLTPD